MESVNVKRCEISAAQQIQVTQLILRPILGPFLTPNLCFKCHDQ